MKSAKPSDNFKAAFIHPFNLIGLASFGAISGAMVDLRPAAAGIALEVIFLGVSTLAPQGSAVNRFIYSKPFGEIRLLGHKTPIERVSKQTILPLLRPEMKAQYSNLEQLSRSILKAVTPDTAIYESINSSLDYLQNKFLLFAIRELEFRERLVLLVEESESLNPDRPHLKIVAGSNNEAPREEPVPNLISRARAGYEAEAQRIGGLQTAGATHDTDKLSERLTVLRRRSRHAERVGKALQNVHLEMNKIEDKLKSMDQEGLAANPAQALKDLKGLAVETDSVTRTIEDIEPLEELKISEAA